MHSSSLSWSVNRAAPGRMFTVARVALPQPFLKYSPKIECGLDLGGSRLHLQLVQVTNGRVGLPGSPNIGQSIGQGFPARDPGKSWLGPAHEGHGMAADRQQPRSRISHSPIRIERLSLPLRWRTKSRFHHSRTKAIRRSENRSVIRPIVARV